MFLTYFKIGQCPFVYITIFIDFLPRSLQCCPVTQSVPHTLIFPQIILYSICWLNTLKLTVVNEQVKIHWPIKSNFMLYTFSTVTPCYCIKGAHVRKESISFYLWLTYVQFAPLCFSWREEVQHTAGLVAPNEITGTQFPPFHSSFSIFQNHLNIFRASQNLKWLVYCMSFRSQYKVMCWICVNTIVFFVVFWIVGPLQWFQKWSCTSVSTSTA